MRVIEAEPLSVQVESSNQCRCVRLEFLLIVRTDGSTLMLWACVGGDVSCGNCDRMWPLLPSLHILSNSATSPHLRAA
jgi:hypothetical protein